MRAVRRFLPVGFVLALLALALPCLAQSGDYRGSRDSSRGESYRSEGFRGGFPGGFPGGGFPGGGFPGGGFPGGGPPGMYGGFRGPPGGFPGGGSSSGGFDPREMVRRADTNNNGMIDPSEMQEGMGRYIQRSAERAGLNVNSPLAIDQVVNAMDQARREREGDYSRSSSSSSSSSSSAPQTSTNPLAFGATTQVPKLPGFETPLSGPGSTTTVSSVPLEKRFDERVLERAKDRIREYDRNNNGTVEGEELNSYRGDPPLITSDLNKDNAINLEEMAQRYQARYGSSYGAPGGPGSPGVPPGSSSFSSRSFGGPGGFPGGSPPFGGGYPGGFPSGSSPSSSSSFRPPFPPPSSSSSSTSSPSSNNDRVKELAQRALGMHDQNRDGKLTKDEWVGMREPGETYDTNKDNIITIEEISARLVSRMSGSGDRERSFSGGPGGFPVAPAGFPGGPGGFSGDRGSSGGDRRSFSGGPGGFPGGPGGFPGGPGGFSSRGSDSSGRSSSSERGGSGGDRRSFGSSSSGPNSAPVAKKSYRLNSPVDRLPQNLPSWFFDGDQNADGQIAMAEYRRRSTEKENAEEFMKIDTNSDGFITSSECLAYLGTSTSR